MDSTLNMANVPPIILDSIVSVDSSHILVSEFIIDKADSNRWIHHISIEGFKYSKFHFEDGFETSFVYSTLFSLYKVNSMSNGRIANIYIKNEHIWTQVYYNDNSSIFRIFYCDYRLCNTCFDHVVRQDQLEETLRLPFRCAGSKKHDLYILDCQLKKSFPIRRREWNDGELIIDKEVPYSENFK